MYACTSRVACGSEDVTHNKPICICLLVKLFRFYDELRNRMVSSVRHRCWHAGFESRSGHTENLKNDTCGLSSLVLRNTVDEWKEKLYARCCHWPATKSKFTEKAAAWPT